MKSDCVISEFNVISSDSMTARLVLADYLCPLARKTINSFLGKTYLEICARDFRSKPVMLQYLSEFGFFCLIPAVVFHSIDSRNADDMHLVVEELLCMSLFCGQDDEVNHDKLRWKLFSQSQIKCVINWVLELNKEIKEYINDDALIEGAAECLRFHLLR